MQHITPPIFITTLLEQMESSTSGLSTQAAQGRQQRYGLNTIASHRQESLFVQFFGNFKNPLVVFLMSLGIISLLMKDIKSAVVMFAMVTLTILLKFFQELKAGNAAQKLASMVVPTATVLRDGLPVSIDTAQLVPGDVVRLAAGDMIPADVHLLHSRDLFINQIFLTGEALPVEKHVREGNFTNAYENPNLCFMGSNVASGAALGLVVATGQRTQLGMLQKTITQSRPITAFDRGINAYTWLMIKMIIILGCMVFVINGLLKHEWFEAFLYAVAVAVGLTPEMLSTIITVNLSKGALVMQRKKVIVKQLNAIQNFGAMDVLCTDKTGTITNGKITLQKHIDLFDNESETVLDYAFINSFYQTGMSNIMDAAIMEHREHNPDYLEIEAAYSKIDELPFDFMRRRMSVIVERRNGSHLLICKGAYEEVLRVCSLYTTGTQELPIDEAFAERMQALVHRYNSEGFRVVAVACKEIDTTQQAYGVDDENNLTLFGFLAFLDSPKVSAREAIASLNQYHIAVKVLTGDNAVVARKICGDVGIPVDTIMLGNEIEEMNDAQLREAVEGVYVFAKLAPMHKKRIVQALKEKNHVVGFMGDGINDAPALRQADIGISVDGAADIARESSDIILLENNLLVLRDGVLEGRKVFCNILKYIKMSASSNFGNMFSVVGASFLLPFLPMKPVQVLTNNLLYDFSQTVMPGDNVDAEWLKLPRRWEITGLRRYIVTIGPISSLFDYATFFVLIHSFGALDNQAIFQTGWFIESLLTQTLIIHVLRTDKIPFLQSRASVPVMLSSLCIVATGIYLTYSPLAEGFGFTAMPVQFFIPMAIFMLGYACLTQAVKNWYVKRYES